MVVVGWVEIMPRYLNVPEWVSSTVVVGCKVVCIDRHFLEYNLKIFAPNKLLLDDFLMLFNVFGIWRLESEVIETGGAGRPDPQKKHFVLHSCHHVV